MKKPFFWRFQKPWQWPRNVANQESWKRVEFSSDTGANLVGLYGTSFRNQIKGSILCVPPLSVEAKGFFLRYGHADFLRENGYNVFVFDFNGTGESTNGNFDYPSDVYAAGQRLTELSPCYPIGVLGISLGAAMSICACGLFQDHPFKVAVFEGAFTSLSEFWARYLLPALLLRGLKIFRPNQAKRLLPIEQIARIQRLNKILFIHSKLDEHCPVEMAYRLRKQTNIPSEAWIFPEKTHTKAIEANSREYREKVLNFLNGSLWN